MSNKRTTKKKPAAPPPKRTPRKPAARATEAAESTAYGKRFEKSEPHDPNHTGTSCNVEGCPRYSPPGPVVGRRTDVEIGPGPVVGRWADGSPKTAANVHDDIAGSRGFDRTSPDGRERNAARDRASVQPTTRDAQKLGWMVSVPGAGLVAYEPLPAGERVRLVPPISFAGPVPEGTLIGVIVGHNHDGMPIVRTAELDEGAYTGGWSKPFTVDPACIVDPLPTQPSVEKMRLTLSTSTPAKIAATGAYNFAKPPADPVLAAAGAVARTLANKVTAATDSGPTLDDVLKDLGYTHKHVGNGEHELELDGSFAFRGTAGKVWEWLIDGGQYDKSPPESARVRCASTSNCARWYVGTALPNWPHVIVNGKELAFCHSHAHEARKLGAGAGSPTLADPTQKAFEQTVGAIDAARDKLAANLATPSRAVTVPCRSRGCEETHELAVDREAPAGWHYYYTGGDTNMPVAHCPTHADDGRRELDGLQEKFDERHGTTTRDMSKIPPMPAEGYGNNVAAPPAKKTRSRKMKPIDGDPTFPVFCSAAEMHGCKTTYLATKKQIIAGHGEGAPADWVQVTTDGYGRFGEDTVVTVRHAFCASHAAIGNAEMTTARISYDRHAAVSEMTPGESAVHKTFGDDVDVSPGTTGHALAELANAQHAELEKLKSQAHATSRAADGFLPELPAARPPWMKPAAPAPAPELEPLKKSAPPWVRS